MLAPDAIWTADSGGKASAARRPVVGADKVAKAIIGIFRLGQKLPDVRIETAMYNSAPAVVVYSGDHLEGVFLVEIDRRQDHPLLRDAQPRQAGWDHDPAGDQPLVRWVTIGDDLSRTGRRRDLKGMTDYKETHKVVVIGGGYAGTLAANRLQQNSGIDITLVNPRPKFVQRLRLHQLVAGTGDATADYGTLLGDGVQLVVDSATRIDTADRKVLLASGYTLNYDYLIYAVGSTAAVPAADTRRDRIRLSSCGIRACATAARQPGQD